MKKIILALSLFVMAFSANAQSDSYTAGMKSLLAKLQAAKNSPEAYQEAANGFTRVSMAEKTEWLPKYYAAYSTIMQAMCTTQKEKIDVLLDQADRMLSEISVTTSNDEVLCLQAFSKSTRIGVDPMTRGMKFGPESAKFLAQAKAQNPDNPRIYFLQGEAAFHTPEQFGGGKKMALQLFQTASDKFDKFNPKNDLMPTWGKEPNKQMLTECTK